MRKRRHGKVKCTRGRFMKHMFINDCSWYMLTFNNLCPLSWRDTRALSLSLVITTEICREEHIYREGSYGTSAVVVRQQPFGQGLAFAKGLQEKKFSLNRRRSVHGRLISAGDDSKVAAAAIDLLQEQINYFDAWGSKLPGDVIKARDKGLPVTSEATQTWGLGTEKLGYRRDGTSWNTSCLIWVNSKRVLFIKTSNMHPQAYIFMPYM